MNRRTIVAYWFILLVIIVVQVASAATLLSFASALSNPDVDPTSSSGQFAQRAFTAMNTTFDECCPGLQVSSARVVACTTSPHSRTHNILLFGGVTQANATDAAIYATNNSTNCKILPSSVKTEAACVSKTTFREAVVDLVQGRVRPAGYVCIAFIFPQVWQSNVRLCGHRSTHTRAYLGLVWFGLVCSGYHIAGCLLLVVACQIQP